MDNETQTHRNERLARLYQLQTTLEGFDEQELPVSVATTLRFALSTTAIEIKRLGGDDVALPDLDD